MTAAYLHEAERFFHEKIPLTLAMDLRVLADHRGFAVSAPVAKNFNHLHTAFGGSINAVATLAAYGFLWTKLRHDPLLHLVVQQSSIRFLRPVRETIYAICPRPDPVPLAEFTRQLEACGKAGIDLGVRVEEGGAVAADFSGRFVALRRPPATAAGP